MEELGCCVVGGSAAEGLGLGLLVEEVELVGEDWDAIVERGLIRGCF